MVLEIGATILVWQIAGGERVSLPSHTLTYLLIKTLFYIQFKNMIFSFNFEKSHKFSVYVFSLLSNSLSWYYYSSYKMFWLKKSSGTSIDAQKEKIQDNFWIWFSWKYVIKLWKMNVINFNHSFLSWMFSLNVAVLKRFWIMQKSVKTIQPHVTATEQTTFILG